MDGLCSYYGNAWIGMFAKTNNEITLAPVDASEKLVKAIEEKLETRVLKTLVGGSNILGIYLAMNSNGLILPNVVGEKEIELIKKTGLNVYVSQEKKNAHGNNILVNDKGGLINKNISNEERKNMEDVLGVELVPRDVAKYATVGSACLANNNGFLAHYNTSDEEMAVIGKILKVNGSKGSINYGTGFISLGVITNDHGYVAGEKTSAFELGKVEEALGFLDK